MNKLKISNIKLVFILCYHKTFTNTIVKIPKDINEDEVVCGCLLFYFTFIFIILLFTMLIGYLFN